MSRRLTYVDEAGAHDTHDDRDLEHYERPEPADLAVDERRAGQPGPLADAFRAAVARVRAERGEG